MTREVMVQRLVTAALNGMTQVAEPTTSGEVIAACMSIALRAVEATHNKECLRDCIEKMWAMLPAEKAAS